MTDKPALIGGKIEHWQYIVKDVVMLAHIDHMNQKPRRTGTQLLRSVTNDGRIRHKRLVSTIYNQYRDELEGI